ncbi:outer membrane protein OmpK [Bdellovibrio sp. SKB1291214]|uniref:nucleoside-specific channel-forming Tsx family protein n=1 Tax=Bdellovibrio sp. SKB1291214 TaxID=1732569 RepID=UPI000B515324|nr:outer membrane protein OmpK [Bdellovibrio sp. SKB1291214]UYL09485.1 outer membrane protein OmpK [Bdellovibrio sp. SKB1291214]
MIQRLLIAIVAIILLSPMTSAFAAKVTDGDIHKGDFRWFQFNLMQSIDNKIPFQNQQDTYFEMEFGGRSGIIDLYGYLDIFDIFNSPNSDRHGDTSNPNAQDDNFFFKFSPRFSLDYMTRSDLSLGPVQELYIATLFNVGDRALFEEYIGLGSDIQVPWLGKLGANLMARHVRENYGANDEGSWNGYILSTNWFKPFVEFQNQSFITWQGYLDYKFGADKIADDVDRTSWSLEWFNGFYWHSKQYAVGYGLKYYQNMALFKSGGIAGETSGFGHYLDLTYKF